MPSQLIAPPENRAEGPLVYLSTHFVRAKEYFEAIVTSTSDAICTTDMQGNIIYFSPGAERMSGMTMSQVLGLPVARFYEGGLQEAKRIMNMLMRQGSVSDYETTVIASNGRRVPVSLAASFLKDRKGAFIGTLGISKDISRRVELERQLRELSITDSLTGLFNQRHCAERISSEMRRAQRQDQKLSILLMDLDRFKQANDNLGHLEGDRILKETADILRQSIRQGVDEAFRYGGDEFVALLPGLGPTVANRVASRIRRAAAQKSYSKIVGLSIGQASLKKGDSLTTLLSRADRAMYLAKPKAR